MTRVATLRYDRGTLILYPPPKGQTWVQFVTWDDRIEKFRLPAREYRRFLETVTQENVAINDEAKNFAELSITSQPKKTPFAHQQEALQAWQDAGRQGVVVLPTGSGKSYLAELALRATPRSTLICVPTLDLMQQWYANLEKAFPELEIGLLGGGSKDESPILVATYDSAAIFAEKLGNRYGLLIFDECHHLPSDFKRSIADYSLAPYRLGLSATPERSDGREHDLSSLIGPVVYSKKPEELAGTTLAKHRVQQIYVDLTEEERQRYDALLTKRNQFLREKAIHLGNLKGWQLFVRMSATSKAGREAMLAHREARNLAFGTSGKIQVLAELLTKHHRDRVLIFTDNNAMVYDIAKRFLIPAITHQSKVKERHAFLEAFREGSYPRLVTSRVLNEGVDVPEANVAIVLSGTSTTREYIQRLGRILRRREGKLALLYEVIAKDTSEERVAERRKAHTSKDNGRSGKKPTKARATKNTAHSASTGASITEAQRGEIAGHDIQPIAIDESLSFEDL